MSGGAEGSVCRDARLAWIEGSERCVSGSGWGLCGDEGDSEIRNSCAVCIVGCRVIYL